MIHHRIQLVLGFLALGLGSSVSSATAADIVQNEESVQQIPGKEVTTSEGRKARIWSTAGPVPVSPAPQPFGNTGPNVSVGEVEVVVGKPDCKSSKKARSQDSFDLDCGDRSSQ